MLLLKTTNVSRKKNAKLKNLRLTRDDDIRAATISNKTQHDVAANTAEKIDVDVDVDADVDVDVVVDNTHDDVVVAKTNNIKNIREYMAACRAAVLATHVKYWGRIVRMTARLKKHVLSIRIARDMRARRILSGPFWMCVDRIKNIYCDAFYDQYWASFTSPM